jgi:FkbM family methyltransferase
MPFWMSSAQGGADLREDKDAVLSYSQFGEDQILWQLLQFLRLLKRNGFFVDVGANHPRRYNNTFILYQYYDWRGVNVEPNLAMANLFAELRPDDRVVNCAIAGQDGKATYYRFNHPGLNTIDQITAIKQEKHPAYQLLDTIEMETRTLRSVLYEMVPPGKEIDFMNIDVEGKDCEVLESNDWQVHRPKILCIEDHNLRLDNVSSSRSYTFLRNQGYTLQSMAVVSAFYLRTD